MVAALFDSHAHLISADRERYPTSPLSGVLAAGEFDAPVTAQRLLASMDQQSVERAVAVQRAHVYGFNNAYVLDSAEQNHRRLAAMCMLDALDPQGPALVRQWVRDRGVIGVRMTEPHKGADAAWFASDQAQQVWRAATDEGISIRLHFFRWNRQLCLPVLSTVMERFPSTVVVLDHLSNMITEEAPPDHGVDGPLLDLVRFPNLHLMFSSINLSRLQVAGKSAAPVIARVIESFGAERVLWGSDVGQSKGSYAELVSMAHAAVASLSSAHQQLVLRDNGMKLYWRSARSE